MSEIQTTISARELNLWGRYRAKYGPFNPVRMYDQGNALVAAQINNAHGGKAKPIDFMPYGKKIEEDQIVDADTFMAMLAKTEKAKVVR